MLPEPALLIPQPRCTENAHSCTFSVLLSHILAGYQSIHALRLSNISLSPT